MPTRLKSTNTFFALMMAFSLATAEAFVGTPKLGIQHFQRQRSWAKFGSNLIRTSDLDRSAYSSENEDIETPSIKKLLNEKEYQDVIDSAGDQLVIMKFYAPWCRACKQLDFHYRKLAVEHSEIIFCEVPIKEGDEINNKKWFKELEIAVLPTVFFIRGTTGILHRMGCGMKKIPIFKEKIIEYKTMESPGATVNDNEEITVRTQSQDEHAQ